MAMHKWLHTNAVNNLPRSGKSSVFQLTHLKKGTSEPDRHGCFI